MLFVRIYGIIFIVINSRKDDNYANFAGRRRTPSRKGNHENF